MILYSHDLTVKDMKFNSQIDRLTAFIFSYIFD